jgi:sugar transferase (PEP-CTERM system associated)
MDVRLVLIVVSDVVLALTALFSASVLRLGSFALSRGWQAGQGVRACTIFVLVTIFSSYLMEVYNLPRESRKRKILIACLQTGCASFFLLSVVYYLDPSAMLRRGVLFIALALFIVFQFVWHAVAASGARRSSFVRRVLILGTGDLACQLGALLADRDSFTLVGYVECGEWEPGHEAGRLETVHQAQQVGDRLILLEQDLLQTARNHRATMIVVALAEKRGVLPLQEMMRCKLDGIEVVDASTFYEIVQGKLMLEQLAPSAIIFSSGFHRTAIGNVNKRCFDLVLSLLGILCSAPFFPLIALAIKLDSKGPIFFRQLRVGNGEKPFVLYKLRSMTQNAEQGGAVWAQKNDARVTRVGKFLRNTRIDELPQLYNVLKGEMSFIGPRPERPEFVESLKKEISYYSKRHTIKPGITGWAQVRYPYGATVDDAVEKLSYDLYYIKNLSLLLDSQILFETVKVVLFGRGAR